MMTKLKNMRRMYAAIKTGFDSTMEPELLERTPEYTPVTIGDHIQAIETMFETADTHQTECWIA